MEEGQEPKKTHRKEYQSHLAKLEGGDQGDEEASNTNREA
jgi:hypothetical protein